MDKKWMVIKWEDESMEMQPSNKLIFEKYGVVVVKNVLTEDECALSAEEVWELVSRMSGGNIKKDKPNFKIVIHLFVEQIKNYTMKLLCFYKPLITSVFTYRVFLVCHIINTEIRQKY